MAKRDLEYILSIFFLVILNKNNYQLKNDLFSFRFKFILN